MRIKIIHLPPNRDAYQRLFLNHLKNLKLDVNYGRKFRLGSFIYISPVFNALRNYKVDIFHFHHQHQFFLGNSLFSTLLKSILFLAELRLVKD